MNQVINTFITGLNNIGQGFCDYATGIFIQVSLLIVLLLIIDFMLRKRVRAVFRYCLWMLLFVKLVLPASFTLPTGIGYWLGDYFPSEVSISKFTPQIEEAVPMLQIEEPVPMVIDIPQWYVLDTPIMYETATTKVKLESISWQGLVFSGWLMGMLILSALLVRRFYFVRGLIANSRPANERSLEMLQECRSRMSISRNIELRLTGGKPSPAVCGFFKPVILMPAALLQKLSREKLRAVLIHELAHIKRGDAWVNLLQTILQIVYFYNPLLWLANVMIRRAREQAVDEMVLVTLRPETKNYSNMLIDIAEMAFWRPNFSLRIIGVVESKKALERRINHMLTRPVPKSSKLGSLGLIAIVAIGAILLPMGRNSMAEAAETKTIIPGVRVGDYTLDMSKDEVLRKLGEPESIQLGEDEIVRRGEEKYTLNNLPREYIMAFGDVSFFIHEDSAQGIFVRSPLYKLSNGLGVGDSEQKIKQAYGGDFQLEEVLGKEFLFYHPKGLAFHIDKKNQTVDEIVVYQTEGHRDATDQQEHPQQTIVPGLGVGDYTLGMSKDEVLRKLGEPKHIHYSGEIYTLSNLPRKYYMSFGDICFKITDDTVTGIGVNSPHYKFTNGLGVGDSEEKIKQAFGSNFQLEEYGWKDQLNYEDKGLQFEIRRENRTVIGIDVYQAEGNQQSDRRSRQDLLTTVRQAAADGRIWYKVTTPDEFKKIAGRPTREWTEGDDEVIYMEYPGIEVKFVGLDNSPHTVVYVLCERVGIDIGQDRPIDERDLDQQSKHTIVPGLRVGAYTLDMSKDDVLKKLGEPETIQLGFDDVDVVRRGQERYSLNNLPNHYILCFGDISFWFEDDSAEVMISVHSPLYKLSNGLGVGDSEQKIKQAVGEDFQLEKVLGKDFLCYHAKGIGFKINKYNQTVAEIVVYKPQGNRGDQEDRRGRDRVLESLPHYNPKSTENWQVDLRDRDVSRLDLRKSLDDLLYADFDSRTTWPTADRMPEGFDHKRIMELAKNPGLGVRKVHERGITGREIGIAIVDQPLLTKHQEYAGRLRLYEEINVKLGSDASMHGAAVASIAVGKTVGVAPDADLYYIGSWTVDRGKGEDGFEWNFAYYAQAVRRILDINKQLPDDRKIRVISMSVGWSPKQKGYDEMTAAVEEAKKAGMLVVCSCIDDVHGFVFDGLGRAPLSDPDDFASYEPGLWLAEGFYRGQRKWNQLWVPMDSRTTAAPNGIDEYVFYRQGGWSWAIPYVAGVYALAAQVDPEITPERFWKLAMKTGRTVEVEHQGRKYELGQIVDPGALIDALKDN